MKFNELQTLFKKGTAGWSKLPLKVREANFQLLLLTILFEINSNLDSVSAIFRKANEQKEK